MNEFHLKHGTVNRVIDWSYSSFHKFVRQGIYPPTWECKEDFNNDIQNKVETAYWLVSCFL